MTVAVALPSVHAPWREDAACTGLATRDRDPWCPDDDLGKHDRDFQWHLARIVCSTCPVRTACALDALRQLPKQPEDAMRGGLTPNELREVAKGLGWPYRLRAQCGTRSAYVAGCRCDDCRNAHRVYEHERRLQQPARHPKRDQTPRAKVAARINGRPRTAQEVADQTGLPLRDVRILLAAEVAAGRVGVKGGHPPDQQLRYTRATATRRAA